MKLNNVLRTFLVFLLNTKDTKNTILSFVFFYKDKNNIKDILDTRWTCMLFHTITYNKEFINTKKYVKY